MIWIFQRIKDLWSIFKSRDSARQLGWALALGMLAGVVPKGNLTSIVLITVMFSGRINLAVGVLSMCVFSWIGLLVDPLGAWLGETLLTMEYLRSFWAWLFDLPIVSWTSLNDTLVLGNLLLGLIAVYPMARTAIPLWQRFLDRRSSLQEADIEEVAVAEQVQSTG